MHLQDMAAGRHGLGLSNLFSRADEHAGRVYHTSAHFLNTQKPTLWRPGCHKLDLPWTMAMIRRPVLDHRKKKLLCNRNMDSRDTCTHSHFTLSSLTLTASYLLSLHALHLLEQALQCASTAHLLQDLRNIKATCPQHRTQQCMQPSMAQPCIPPCMK